MKKKNKSISQKYKTIMYILLTILVIIIAGFLLPQKFIMNVEGATGKDYNENSFWFYPWGKSVVHKGVDIFATEGTNVFSATYGLVLKAKTIYMGGNVVLILGTKWRLHYYAHLKEIKTSAYSFVKPGDIIGTVGTSGNAKGKSPHLHYSIATIFPYIWRIDKDRQGCKKMFYLNPIDYLKGISKNSTRTSLRGRYLPTGQAGDRSNLNIKAYCIRLLPISFLMVRNDDEVFRDALKEIKKQ